MSRRIVLALCLVLISLTTMAQTLDKRVLTHTTPYGTMYFISDKKLSKHSQDVKKFMYDVTCIEMRDSVVINSTLVSANPNDVAELSLTNGEQTVKADSVGVLYHQIKGSKYEIRTTARISYADFKSVCSGASPVEFRMVRTDGTPCSATYSDSQWKKEKEFFERVFYVINKK